MAVSAVQWSAHLKVHQMSTDLFRPILILSARKRMEASPVRWPNRWVDNWVKYAGQTGELCFRSESSLLTRHVSHVTVSCELSLAHSQGQVTVETCLKVIRSLIEGNQMVNKTQLWEVRLMFCFFLSLCVFMNMFIPHLVASDCSSPKCICMLRSNVYG